MRWPIAYRFVVCPGKQPTSRNKPALVFFVAGKEPEAEQH